jgi:uncharacterized membrane protein SirB2
VVEFYSPIKWVHVSCVIASGSLFAWRGLLSLKGSAWANHPRLRLLSYCIDTALLAAALMLAGMLHQWPFQRAWLTTKVLLLPVYIVCGIFALRAARTPLERLGFLVAAVLIYGFIVSVALTHNPGGFFYYGARLIFPSSAA